MRDVVVVVFPQWTTWHHWTNRKIFTCYPTYTGKNYKYAN